MHPDFEVRHDPFGQHLDRCFVDPVAVGIVRVAVVSGGRDDRDAGRGRGGTQQFGPPPEPDGRHLDDRLHPG